MSDKISVYKRMADIQSSLNAPKNQNNTFGNYKYRSAEDIIEAVKPLLLDHGAYLNLDDEIVMVGDRIYVKSIAKILFPCGGEVSATGFAREASDRKGMNSDQLSGATSSYARKYALNGLLATDDSKDSDSSAGRETNPAYNIDKTTPELIEGYCHSLLVKMKAASNKAQVEAVLADKLIGKLDPPHKQVVIDAACNSMVVIIRKYIAITDSVSGFLGVFKGLSQTMELLDLNSTKKLKVMLSTSIVTYLKGRMELITTVEESNLFFKEIEPLHSLLLKDDKLWVLEMVETLTKNIEGGR